MRDASKHKEFGAKLVLVVAKEDVAGEVDEAEPADAIRGVSAHVCFNCSERRPGPLTLS